MMTRSRSCRHALHLLFSAALTAALMLAAPGPAGAEKEAPEKNLLISGLKIYSRTALIKELKLNTLKPGKWHFPAVALAVNSFYQKQGYLLVKTYLIEENDRELKIYVDEGRLGRIIFKDQNTIGTLRMRYEFHLPYKIYHKPSVEEEEKRIAKKYRYARVYAGVKPARSFEKSLFQLNQPFSVPGLGEMRLPFFNRFQVRYDMEVEFVKKSSSGVPRPSTSYGLDIHYTKGLIPFVKYRHPGLLASGDRFEADASMGIYYGLDLKFTTEPRWTYMEAGSKYYFTPMIKDYFTPRVKGSVYHSRASRSDLGLLNYNYAMVKGSLDPGVTLLDRLKLFAGYGNERVFVYESKVDPEARYSVNIQEETELWHYLELSFSFKRLPWDFNYLVDRRFDIIYNYYVNEEINEKRFHELNIRGRASHEFENLNIVFLRADYAQLWLSPPFYHEYPVTGNTFKGLMGRGFYSRRLLRVDTEYWLPVYRDHVYLGVYADAVWFEGSGYDLSGEQGAVVAGLSGHLIVLDQFEFNIYYGWDRLFSDDEIRGNLYFNLEKKW
ncbi:MAG TPA: hypothetical protein ENN21_01340 [Spirochaetes bacterium]|nr:hypothetical protein [Spirochaetota bacterium]